MPQVLRISLCGQTNMDDSLRGRMNRRICEQEGVSRRVSLTSQQAQQGGGGWLICEQTKQAREREERYYIPEQVRVDFLPLDHAENLALHLVEHIVPHRLFDLPQPGPSVFAARVRRRSGSGAATADGELARDDVLLGGCEPNLEEFLRTCRFREQSRFDVSREVSYLPSLAMGAGI